MISCPPLKICGGIVPSIPPLTPMVPPPPLENPSYGTVCTLYSTDGVLICCSASNTIGDGNLYIVNVAERIDILSQSVVCIAIVGQ